MAVVLFGATGYTGGLVARALLERGVEPILVGRHADRLRTQATRLGGLRTAVADAATPASLEALLGHGDVLVTTVGPFTTLGEAALQAAVRRRAVYLDSTGEPAFVRRVFLDVGPSADAPLLTAFGYDYVPGNLAGALALAAAVRTAGEEGPASVEIGYFLRGSGGVSSGTLASGAQMLLADSHAYRGGRIVTERPAARRLRFGAGARGASAVTIGGTEHWQLPRLSPGLSAVDVGIGWFGPAAGPVTALSALTAPVLRMSPVRTAAAAAARGLTRRTGRGPDARGREARGSRVVAVVRDRDHRLLASVALSGPDPYGLTGRLLAWGAQQAAAGAIDGSGALGPVDAFGLERLRDGAASCGLVAEDALADDQ